MNQEHTAAAAVANAPSARELLARTDEEIGETAPGSPDRADVAQTMLSGRDEALTDAKTAQTGLSVLPEPPPWLAAQMKDLWNGDEARDLWDGVQQARQEAAAYREVFAKPEEARAAVREAQTLKELYPGGVDQARASAERARTLDEIDAAFYGGAGKSPGEQSAGRAALAQRMLREDPPAFREMVFAGLRALEESGSAPATSAQGSTAPAPLGARHAAPPPPAAEHPPPGEY